MFASTRARESYGWSAIVRFWIFRACVFAKHSDWRSQRVFRCDRGVERENRKICGIFFTSVQVTPILNTAYAAMLKDTSGGTFIIWKSENIANHHFVHIHCYMLLSLQVSNNWPTDYLPWKFRLFLIARFSVTASGGYKGAGRNTGRKSRFKNTSTKNFEVFTWILACICTRMLWIIWLNAHSQYLTVFVLSYFGCRQFWENGQFRPRTPCQNEPKICRRHRRTLKFHILGGLGVLMHLDKYGVISFTVYRVMIKCVPYSGVWPQSGGILASR